MAHQFSQFVTSNVTPLMQLIIDDQDLNTVNDINETNNAGWNVLHMVCRTPTERAPKYISALIKYGINTNAQDSSGMTPLMHAVRSQDTKVVNAVLPHSNVDIQSRYGWTALMYAVCYSKYNLDIVKLLTPLTNLELRDECGYTALFLAVLNYDNECDPACFEILQKAGANVHAKSKSGYTLDFVRKFRSM